MLIVLEVSTNPISTLLVNATIKVDLTIDKLVQQQIDTSDKKRQMHISK
jgi:hypothetical protein